MSNIYGIDLGTTNSLLGLNGELLTGLVPSVVNLHTGQTGTRVKYDTDAERSFKCNVSLTPDGAIAVNASACVLSQLVRESGANVKDVVISVPAYFTDNQRQATIKAANKVGLNVVRLINEPTAAAIYISRERNSLSVIFDLGGGTFDVSVIDSRFGDYDVQATDGCLLGGDDLDNAIRSWVIREGQIRLHKVCAADLSKLKWECTDLKHRIQKSRNPEALDLSAYGAGRVILTPETYMELIDCVFAPAIVKAKRVIGESVPDSEPYDLIMVGGSTRCPYLREWVAQKLNHEPVEMSYNPDLIVAQGASIYAQMLMDGTADRDVSDVTKALSIGMSDGTAWIIIERNAKIPVEESVVVWNDTESSILALQLYQGDSSLSCNNECIGILNYDYGRIVPAGQGIVTVGVYIRGDGTIEFSCEEIGHDKKTIVLDRKRGE